MVLGISFTALPHVFVVTWGSKTVFAILTNRPLTFHCCACAYCQALPGKKEMFMVNVFNIQKHPGQEGKINGDREIKPWSTCYLTNFFTI